MKEGNGCQQRKDVNWKSASFLPPHFHLPPHPAPQLYEIKGTQNLNTRKWLWPWQRLGCMGCCINCNLERIHCHQSSSPPNITLYVFLYCLPTTDSLLWSLESACDCGLNEWVNQWNQGGILGASHLSNEWQENIPATSSLFTYCKKSCPNSYLSPSEARLGELLTMVPENSKIGSGVFSLSFDHELLIPSGRGICMTAVV